MKSMKSIKTTLLWALVLLNTLLLLSFLDRVTRDNAAIAQPAARRPGDYLMISGEVTGAGAGALVYIVDTTNSQLSAITYDDANNTLQNMQRIDLGSVFTQGNTGGARRPPGKP